MRGDSLSSRHHVYRWKFAVISLLACALGVGAGLVLQKNSAGAAVDPTLAAKMLADRKAEPDASVIQATYNFEIKLGSPAHDKDLKLLTAKCMKGQDTAHICFVSFLSTADPDERIYNSVTEIARIGDGWSLKSGLCKRLGG
jgi:hypothetical protein